MADNSSPSPQPASGSAQWSRTVLWLGLFLILVAGSLLVFRSCLEAPGRVIEKTGTALERVAAAFNRGTITTAFISYATTLSNSLHLQFATLSQMEVFTRKEETSTAFGYIPLPEVVVEARAPVEYTYYLDLNDRWKFVLENSTLYVFPPPIRFNKPAVDASAITYEVKKNVPFKSGEVQEKLKQSVSGLVRLRAKENIPLVRETGRRQTMEFVERWLARSFADGREVRVKVVFPDEPPAVEAPAVAPALK